MASREYERNEAADLPGFYFDAEKNRYFRVLSGSNNHNPLTMKKIMERDSRRRANHRTPKPRIKMKNSMNLMFQRSIGQYHSNRRFNFALDVTKSKLISCLDKKGVKERYVQGPCCMVPNKDYSRMLFYAKKTDSRSYMTLECWSLDRRWDICDLFRYSSFCFLNSDPHRTLVACTLTSKIMLSHNYGVGRNVRAVKGKSPFCCSSAQTGDSKYTASVGDGPHVILISNLEAFFRTKAFHPRGGPGSTVKRLERDVLAQSFSYMPNLHFNGLRGGSILGLDFRNSSRNPVCCALHSPLSCNVRQIHPLQDEYSLLAGYENPRETPKIFLWDIRFASRPVLEYQSNCTERRCEFNLFKFTVNVDKNETILTSVLPDLRARFWSIKTGELVKTYPELDDSSKSVTAAAFTTDWVMFNGRSGVLVFADDNAEFFDFVA